MCGKTDTGLKACIYPWVMFHSAAVSTWTLNLLQMPSGENNIPACAAAGREHNAELW